MIRRCKTPGAEYRMNVESAGKFNNYHVVRFTIDVPRSRATINEATARLLEDALHNAAERVLGKTWVKAPASPSTGETP